MDNTLVGVQEAAEILQVTRQSIYNWLGAGTLKPAMYITRRPVFYRGEIERLAEARKQTATAKGE